MLKRCVEWVFGHGSVNRLYRGSVPVRHTAVERYAFALSVSRSLAPFPA